MSSVGGGGEGGALLDFFFCSLFPVQQTTSEGWPPCKVLSFFGLATNTLSVRNKKKVGFSLTLHC